MGPTIAQRAAVLQEEIEALRHADDVSSEARLISLTIEAGLLRIEDRVVDILENLPST